MNPAQTKRTALLAKGTPLEKGANYTVKATDNGAIVVATAADLTITLPSSPPPNFQVTIMQNALSTGTGLVVDIPAAHTLVWNSKTAGQDLTNSGASDVIGDSVTLRYYNLKWYIIHMRGTWA